MQSPVHVDMITRMACSIHRPDIAVELGAHSNQAYSNSTGNLNHSTPGTFVVFEESGNKPSNHTLCSRDPSVQRAVSSVLAILASSTGILTMFTTAWWGQRSDMWGRTRILAVAVVAMAAGELNMIFVARSISWLPGKAYWFLIPGNVVLGVLGGGSGTVPMQAYLADVTTPETRASVFSIWGGTSWIAVAVGPIISAALIHSSPTGSLLNVYYASLCVNVFLFIVYSFIIPESLPEDVRQDNLNRYYEQRSKSTENLWLGYVRDLFSPQAVCLPRPRTDGRRGLDWNLTYTTAAYLCLVMVSGATVYIMQLMQADFGWDAVGYWASVLGFTRAAYLLFLLPAVLAYFRPKEPAAPYRLNDGGSEEETLLPTSTSDTSIGADDSSPWFDLAVVRWSLFGDGLSYFGMLIAQTVEQFVAVSMGLTFGGGMMPAFMSLALALSPNGAAEGGKLFGAFGFFTSLGAEVLGQWVLGGISFFFSPRSMLLACSVILAVSFFFTLSIKLSPSVSRRASMVSQS
ncbi:MFS general substrate transporter [Auriculariales sp. MPI-PUGE-AT-0066]|nr:MFS general substrate transporter [Auriculariales sp. MPI-PUGE-AT-0066]